VEVSPDALKKMKSNSDKLEELANSGKLTINRMIFTKKKLTGREWFYAYLEELTQRSYDKEEILECADYVDAARKVSGL